METTVESLEAQALTLPVKDRLRLACTMLKSAPKERELSKEEWEAEMVRRMKAIEDGDRSGVTWEEMKNEFERRYGK